MAASCVFCAIADGSEPAEVVFSSARLIAFLDHRPVFHGHVLLAPRSHVPTLADLPDAGVEPLFTAARLIARTLPEALGAQGTFVGINNVVSQSVPHLHVHVIPRTKGDGLRGFFWPRVRYRDEHHLREVGDLIRAALP